MLSRTLVSRAILLRTLKNSTDIAKQAKRNAGHGVWSYRCPPPMPPKQQLILAEVIGGLIWWWVFHHCVTQYDHIIGEWTYIDPSTWTDAELGIPKDEDGPLKTRGSS